MKDKQEFREIKLRVSQAEYETFEAVRSRSGLKFQTILHGLMTTFVHSSTAHKTEQLPSPLQNETLISSNVKTGQTAMQGPSKESTSSTITGEPGEWAVLAGAAQSIKGRLGRSMYRSIRFQLEFLALAALEQKDDNATILPVRFDDDGELVNEEPDPASPLHRSSRPGEKTKRLTTARGEDSRSVVPMRTRR